MIYDLHVHSTASDGTFSPEELIDEAVKMGLLGIALTDHDTMDGLQPAREYIKDRQLNFDFIPGIEMNTELDENEVHILGYFISAGDSSVNDRLLEIRGQRQQRAQKMVEKLQVLGKNISYDRVINLAGSDLIARPHIAMALIEAGYAANIREAFDNYIGKGKPAYVSRYKFAPDEAVSMINQIGGIAVLAHPGLIRNQSLIAKLMEIGIEGMEVYYPEHSREQIQRLKLLAEENHLLVTGGSDFHGANSAESRSQLGATGINSKLMSKIKAYKNII